MFRAQLDIVCDFVLVWCSLIKQEINCFEFFSRKIVTSLAHIFPFEPPRGKTNNVVSEQVRHKPTCTSTETS